MDSTIVVIQDMRDQLETFPLADTDRIDSNIRTMTNCLLAMEEVIRNS